MSQHNKPWVARALTVLLITMVSSFVVGIPAAAPATAADFAPNSPVVNDVGGTSEDWFMVKGDGTYGYFWNADGSGGSIAEGQPIPATGSVTVYARNYLAQVQSFPMTFTNNPEIRAANTVTISTDQMVCGQTSFFLTRMPVYLNDTYDGGGLSNKSVGVGFFSEDGTDLSYLQSDSPPADGGSVRLDTLSSSWGLVPGWHIAKPYRITYGNTLIFEPEQSFKRVWVPACGGMDPPAGQVPPGGDSSGGSEPSVPRQVQPTGSLKLLRAKHQVKATAINRKVKSRSVFKLVIVSPTRKQTVRIIVPAGQVKVIKVKALARTTYVLKAPRRTDSKLRYERVARLVVKRN